MQDNNTSVTPPQAGAPLKWTPLPEEAFEKLIARYADGRHICNCRQAYYNKNGQCEWGCSANQIFAKEEVGRRALAEIRAFENSALPPSAAKQEKEGAT